MFQGIIPKFMRKLVFLLLSLIVLSSCSGTTSYTSDYSINNNTSKAESRYSDYVNIKYRKDSVDIANLRFEELDTSKSSWIRDAWYDEDNQYMIINLNGTYYHYCGIPNSSWDTFKRANSFGSHYNSSIEGRYDCRTNYIPQY